MGFRKSTLGHLLSDASMEHKTSTGSMIMAGLCRHFDSAKIKLVVFKMSSGKKKGEFSGEEVIAEFERLTRDAATVQRETLRRILDENAAVEYLQRLGLAGRTDPDAFRACVPLATHDDLEPYIRRVADGDASPVLTAKPITSISLSSGTTQGKRKYLPFNDDLFKAAMHVYRTSFAFRDRAYPVGGGGKALQFIYGSRQSTTKGGLTATTATTHLYLHEAFKSASRDFQLPCCSPDAVVFGPDFAESLYCHLLCGLLAADDVRTVYAVFGHNVVLALQALERAWEELCDDIRRGAPSPARVTDPAVRRAVSALLAAPDPALADEVARRCAALSGDGWYGAVPALWPNARYVHAIVTGSMEHYVKKLRHYAGGLPLVAMDYGASEGMVGANVDPEAPPESATFAVLPDIAYFEFIPLKIVNNIIDGEASSTDDDDATSRCSQAAEPVGLTEVTVGEHYEVVMTTFTGLYRYRGRVLQLDAQAQVRVPGVTLALCINVDKSTEQDVQVAVDGAAEILGAAEPERSSLEVVDYASHADVSSDPGHYVVFWELNGGEADDGVLQRCCDELDRGFVDAGYVSSRKTRAIGPLELRLLQRGTFRKVMHHYLSLGTPANQFKLPRCIARSNSGVLQILADNTIKAFFSAAYE
ncbi:hypothetical protein U9M48_021246 [Paspalum notatum var. saurae]|uniref:Jasmonic acid-amido synthetase JAR1 n=1 Tax=Paspalum notatum var. saurae TaxID=547442 RepID=A0AAQ3WTG4_PASNO